METQKTHSRSLCSLVDSLSNPLLRRLIIKSLPCVASILKVSRDKEPAKYFANKRYYFRHIADMHSDDRCCFHCIGRVVQCIKRIMPIIVTAFGICLLIFDVGMDVYVGVYHLKRSNVWCGALTFFIVALNAIISNILSGILYLKSRNVNDLYSASAYIAIHVFYAF